MGICAKGALVSKSHLRSQGGDLRVTALGEHICILHHYDYHV